MNKAFTMIVRKFRVVGWWRLPIVCAVCIPPLVLLILPSAILTDTARLLNRIAHYIDSFTNGPVASALGPVFRAASGEAKWKLHLAANSPRIISYGDAP